MTDPKNTEDQELSLDQLKDAAGGATAIEYGLMGVYTGSSDSSKLRSKTTEAKFKNSKDGFRAEYDH